MSDRDRDRLLWLYKETYRMNAIPPDENHDAFLKAVLIGCGQK